MLLRKACEPPSTASWGMQWPCVGLPHAHALCVTHCRTEAYRAAVDLSAHDFRAWYGLGQAYELLKMPYYALYYYRRARARCV